MPRTMPSGAERVQPMPLTRIIYFILFYFFHLGQFRNCREGRRVGKSEARRERPGDLRPPRLRGGTGGPVPGRSPQPDPEPFSLPRFYFFFNFSYFLFYSRPRFPRRTLGANPSASPGLRQGRAKLAAPGGVRARRGAQDPARQNPDTRNGIFLGVRSGTASCRPPHAQPCPAPSSLRFWGLEWKKGKRRLTKGGCVSGSTAGFSPPGSGKASPRLGHPISPSGPVGAFRGTRARGALPCPAAAAARQRGERRRLAKPLGVYYRGLTTAFPL